MIENLEKKKNLPQTKIETDSYVAVQLIEHHGKLNFDSLKNTAELVQGSFCFTALDENNNLYIVKSSNPMYLIHFEELRLYVYASTKASGRCISAGIRHKAKSILCRVQNIAHT